MALTWKQKFQKYIKRSKQKATLHTLIGTVCTLILVLVLNSMDRNVEVQIERDPESQLTMTFVGDMMFGRNIDDVIVPKYGYDHLFKYVKNYFEYSDYTTGNFESPITRNENYEKADKNIHLSTGEGAAEALKNHGFYTVNLANNHMKDYGRQGLVDTLNAFKKQKIETVGAGTNLQEATQIVYTTVQNKKIALLGFSDILPKDFRAYSNRSGIAPADPNIFQPLVFKARQNADLVIVQMHWGLEYDSGFHPRQQDLGRALIDAGADVVLGHHPHVLEPVEVYNDGVIFYSLGNFVFDQGWSRTKESVLVQLKNLQGDQYKLEIHPMMIREGQPRPVRGWTERYRREKIFSQVTGKLIYTDNWSREGDKLVRIIELKGAEKSDE
ncbi:CapA family protein [Hazenella sp. IB182357]|uniref:CapA family protein n=1 Tax=Polycladospora coralii TaxID=2771432 RepID=A0A926RTZ3_9BACL|nr:CapA family protein [Polycladospora coralii]MBD1371759.1 CapA family protein [Polycladospora coralii]